MRNNLKIIVLADFLLKQGGSNKKYARDLWGARVTYSLLVNFADEHRIRIGCYKSTPPEIDRNRWIIPAINALPQYTGTDTHTQRSHIDTKTNTDTHTHSTRKLHH